MTDNIRRVWFLKSDFFKSEFKNCPIVYVPYGDGKYTLEAQPSLKRLLEILDVDVDKLQPITQPTQYDKIILPDNSFTSPRNPGTCFTAEYREAVDRVRDFALKNRTPTSRKKLYFYYGRKGTTGEEHMAEYFKSKGYEIIRHEQRADFDEELNLMINCESFTSTSGSCSLNSLFLRDNTEFILIPRAASPLNDYQEIINQVRQLNVNYIDSSLSILAINIMTGPYFFIVSEQLKRFFGDKFDSYEEEDFKNFLQYVKNSMNEGRSFNQSAKNYYSPVLEDFMAQLKKREDLITACDMPPCWETFKLSMLEGLSYQTHVHNRGWRDGWKGENMFSNPLDQKLDVLAIKINFPNHKVYYSVYFNDKEGWSAEVATPKIAGTVGVRKPIYGMRVRFDEAGAKEFDILYRMHTFDGKWTPWAKNGENLYSYGVKINSIQVKLRPLLSYQTHVHNRGWRDGWKGENMFSNPLDQKLEVLAIKVNYPSHKIYYSVYFNDEEGWSAEVQSPEMAGTVGVRKPIYGMRVRFDEAGAKEFDILYRMHKFNDTWTPWAKNGEELISDGIKVNAIQIKLEPKT